LQCCEIHFTAGRIALEQNDLTAAVFHFNEALRINPKKPDVHAKLGDVLIRRKEIGKALEHLNRALEFRPDWPEVLNNLAWIKSTQKDMQYRNPEEAVQFALRACELTGYKEAHMLNTLATAYAALGNFSEAVKMAERTLELVRSEGRAELVTKAQESLNIFRAGRIYGE
jgi:Flp pilus assembly protein TadD